jgi:cytochrome c-type biogenesis protein CcmE
MSDKTVTANRTFKAMATIGVLATAFGALLYASLGSNLQYYKYVDEVMAEPAAWHGKPLKMHGYVVKGSIGKKRGKQEYQFDVQHNGRVVRAQFIGTPPDGFKDESEIVLEGRLGRDSAGADTFVAEHMQAKCPSKYEERSEGVTGL